jgi:hypothetical protein
MVVVLNSIHNHQQELLGLIFESSFNFKKMKKKFIYAFLCVATLSLSLQSCKKYLDVNKNPNSAATVDPKLLFSSATVYYAISRTGGDYWIPFALAGQTVADGFNNPTSWSGGGQTEQEYVISPFSTGNTWTNFYVNIGTNLKQAISLAENATPKNNNAAAQSKVLLALAFYELTTIYGDVPYTEALNTSITAPHFDPQQTVLKGVVSLLDEAQAQFDVNSASKIDGAYDMFYAGDISKWKRLANSVKLRALLTLYDADNSQAAAIGALVAGAGNTLISSAGDNFQIPFGTAAGKQNPKFAISDQYNGGENFFFASKYVTDPMIAVNDPRLPKYFDAAGSTHSYAGIFPGATGDDSINPRISTSLQTADEPETIFDYQEELFFEAEIYARGIGVGQDLTKANSLYKQAITESCKFYGVDAATAATFAAGLPALTAANAVSTIALQHWIDEMDRPLDAFTQWRRSGANGNEIPAFTIPIGAPTNGLFRRYEYPQSNEILINPNAPKDVNSLRYYVKMWFDL